MQLLQSFPPNGLSGLLLLFGRFLNPEGLTLGIPFSSALHPAQCAWLGFRLEYWILLFPEGITFFTLLYVLERYLGAGILSWKYG
jgi:hypothetical protein